MTAIDARDTITLLDHARDRALRVRLQAVRAGARRRVHPRGFVYDLSAYKAVSK